MDRLAHLDKGLKAAVVGGGWAGLAAAVELAHAGIGVTLFEAGKQLGGRARSVAWQGHGLDNGQHLLLGAYRETLRLMRRVGADPERLCRRLPLEIHFPESGGRTFRLRLPVLPAPLHCALGLLTARGVSLAEKIAAARFLSRLQSSAYRLEEDCTVASLLDRYGQSGQLRRYLWEPLCLAALNTAPVAASARIFLNTLRDSLGGERAATDLLLPAVDLSRLFPLAAAQFIADHGGEIRLGRRVPAIDAERRIDGQRYDHCVVAVAPQHAGSLLATHPQTLPIVRLLAGYAYEPIATVYCAYPASVRLPVPMLGLAAGDDHRFGQWVFDRGALCGTPGILAFVLSAGGRWQELSPAALAATLHDELAAVLRIRLPPFAWSQLFRERRATFSCRPDLPRPTGKTALPGVWLAGDYVCAEYPATLEAAVRSGVAAAAGIIGGGEGR